MNREQYDPSVWSFDVNSINYIGRRHSLVYPQVYVYGNALNVHFIPPQMLPPPPPLPTYMPWPNIPLPPPQAYIQTAPSSQPQKITPQNDSDTKVQSCVVCMDAPSNMIISPCMHLCLCAVCANGSHFDKCPKCRGRIECVKKVYF